MFPFLFSIWTGYGGLSVAIDGPHRSEIICTEHKENVYTIDYSPHEPGIYILNIRYADDHVAGKSNLISFFIFTFTWTKVKEKKLNRYIFNSLAIKSFMIDR